MKPTASSAEWAAWVKARRVDLEWSKTTLAQEAGVDRHTLIRLETGQFTTGTIRTRVRDTINAELKRRRAALKELAL